MGSNWEQNCLYTSKIPLLSCPFGNSKMWCIFACMCARQRTSCLCVCIENCNWEAAWNSFLASIELRKRKIEIHLCSNLFSVGIKFGSREICTINRFFFFISSKKAFAFCSLFYSSKKELREKKYVLYALCEPIKFRSVYSRNRIQMQNLFKTSFTFFFHFAWFSRRGRLFTWSKNENHTENMLSMCTLTYDLQCVLTLRSIVAAVGIVVAVFIVESVANVECQTNFAIAQPFRNMKF